MMDNMNHQQYGNSYMGGYGYPQQYGNPFPSYGAMYGGQQMLMAPQQQNILTPEEIALLRSNRGSNVLDLNISNEDYIKSKCNHRDERGQDATYELGDGSGRVCCRVCGEIWDGTKSTIEEVQETTDKFVSMFQNLKWIGGVGNNFLAEYSPIIPLVKKFPEVYKVAINNYQRMTNGMYGGFDNESNIIRQFNALNNGYSSFGYMPNPAFGYYQQPMAPGYMNQPMGGMQAANPNVNPMQAPQNAFGGMAPQPYSPTPQPQYQPQPQQYQAVPQQPTMPGYMNQPMGGYGMAPQAYPAPQSPMAYNAVQSAPQAAQQPQNPNQTAAPAPVATEKKTETVSI